MPIVVEPYSLRHGEPGAFPMSHSGAGTPGRTSWRSHHEGLVASGGPLETDVQREELKKRVLAGCAVFEEGFWAGLPPGVPQLLANVCTRLRLLSVPKKAKTGEFQINQALLDLLVDQRFKGLMAADEAEAIRTVAVHLTNLKKAFRAAGMPVFTQQLRLVWPGSSSTAPQRREHDRVEPDEDEDEDEDEDGGGGGVGLGGGDDLDFDKSSTHVDGRAVQPLDETRGIHPSHPQETLVVSQVLQMLLRAQCEGGGAFYSTAFPRNACFEARAKSDLGHMGRPGPARWQLLLDHLRGGNRLAEMSTVVQDVNEQARSGQVLALRPIVPLKLPPHAGPCLCGGAIGQPCDCHGFCNLGIGAVSARAARAGAASASSESELGLLHRQFKWAQAGSDGHRTHIPGRVVFVPCDPATCICAMGRPINMRGFRRRMCQECPAYEAQQYQLGFTVFEATLAYCDVAAEMDGGFRYEPDEVYKLCATFAAEHPISNDRQWSFCLPIRHGSLAAIVGTASSGSNTPRYAYCSGYRLQAR